jgi:DNA-binding NarL/FixJ family response regulator
MPAAIQTQLEQDGEQDGDKMGVQGFSAFIFELYERAESQDSLALLEWSAKVLARAVHADCAWTGWYDLRLGEIYGAVSHNLPGYYQYWLTMKDEDLIGRDLAGLQRKVAVYQRDGKRQTDGMIAIADRYHLKQMTAFAAQTDNSSVLLFLSLHRGGRDARPMNGEERKYVSAALDHVVRASALADTSMRETPKLIVNERGRILAPSLSVERIFRERWPQWKSKSLSDLVTGALSQRSSNFSREGLSVEKLQISNLAGPSLFSITLRPGNRLDALTDREQQVAEKITLGLTHKEIAHDLGLSPATVRNYTQSALTKLGAPNKAALAAIILSGRNNPPRLGQ